MIGKFPIVTFDTSAHNRLAEGGPVSEALLAGIRSGMHFRFAGLSVNEIVSCPDSAKKTELFRFCARLQLGLSDCLLPPDELVRDLIVTHFENPAAFNWKTVNVRAEEYERGIQRRKVILDPQLSEVGREEQDTLQKEYRQTFTSMRPDIQAVFETNGQTPPRAFREVIAQLRNGGDTLIWDMGEWEMGKLFYDRHSEIDTSEATIKEFMKACPPFRALVYGTLMQWYDLAVRDKHSGERYKAGRNDLLMSVYLPYCDKFVTAESRREQEKCLREVAAVGELETEILSYDDFCDSFLVKI